MRRSLREAVRVRYQFRCGYCGVSERDAGAELTLDHFQPISHQGGDDLENLVYCCHACNEHKGDFWTENTILRLLHPGRDELATHLQEDEQGRLIGLTETGVFHIERLHLNRPPLVEHRLWLRREQASQETSAQIQVRLQDAEARIARMERFFGLHTERPTEQ
jgi:hypothetical protein